jgi:hypothetical protein
MNETYLSECLEKFHDLPDHIQDMVGGFEACLELKKIEDAYNVSLSFAVILIAIGELTIDDLPKYLNLKFQIDLKKGEEISNLVEEKIFAQVLDLILDAELEEETPVTEIPDTSRKFGPLTEMSLADKKEFILKTFTSEIVPALKAEPTRLQDFNIALFQAFNEDEDLEDRVEALLYNNQEKLSDHQIILDNHPASPSIANWLKDFIKKYGSDLFNEVALAEYLSQSPNIKSLKPEEKELVRKVLKLYRNLVFFPQSMDGIAIENWEIFPVNHSEVIKKNISKPENSTENPVITERQKTIFDLQKNLTKYPTTSLEYKAIHQEINRLSRK